MQHHLRSIKLVLSFHELLDLFKRLLLRKRKLLDFILNQVPIFGHDDLVVLWSRDAILGDVRSKSNRYAVCTLEVQKED